MDRPVTIWKLCEWLTGKSQSRTVSHGGELWKRPSALASVGVECINISLSTDECAPMVIQKRQNIDINIYGKKLYNSIN